MACPENYSETTVWYRGWVDRSRTNKPRARFGGDPGSSVMKAPGGSMEVEGAKHTDSGWWAPAPVGGVLVGLDISRC